MEILDFVSHSNHNVTIYVKENTVIYMTKLRNFYLDFPSLTLTTYSDSSSIPGRASIEIVGDSFFLFSPDTTQFNIIAYIDLRLTQALNYSGYTSVETDISDYSSSILIVNRWNFNISNINLYRDVIVNINLDAPFIIAIYEQSHTISLSNMDLHISGRFLRSYQPLNLYAENIYMDFYGMMGGFYIDVSWNYPDASLTGSIFLNNITALNSKSRITIFKSGLLYYAGPANVTIQNTSVNVYGSLTDGRSPIEIQPNTAWSPNDNILQTITIKNNVFSLTSNPDSERFVENYIEIASNYQRQIQVNILNNQIINVVKNVYPIFYWVFTSLTDVYLSNNTISNVSTQQGVITMSKINSATLLSSSFSNSSDFGHSLYHFASVQNVTMKTINLQNISATGGSNDYFFLFDIINNGTVDVESVYMNDVNTGLQTGFYFNGVLSKVSYKSMYFMKVYIGNDNKLMSTGQFSSIDISNITFVDIYDQYSSDDNNYMLSIDTFNLFQSSNSSIKDISIQNSQVNFLKMQSVVGVTSSPINLNIYNITYQDWFFKFKKSLITFLSIKTQQQFYTTFDHITFTNISFGSGGYLMDFGHQTSTQVIVSNLVLTNIYSGTIHLESYDKNLATKTNVLFINGKFDTIDVSTNSIFLLNEGANLEIRNCTFNQVSWTEIGGVIYGSYKNTEAAVYDSSFTNITAVMAALFLIESGSVIRVYRWNMVQNFAITSSLIYALNDGYFEIYDSKIYQNYAIQNIISEMFSSSYLNIIDNTMIYNNVAISSDDIYSEFTGTCKLLWFVPSSLSSYIL